MDTVAGMRVFVRVVESASFSAAARQLGVAPSSVSRQINELEESLGARLFTRTTRKLSLTLSSLRVLITRSAPISRTMSAFDALRMVVATRAPSALAT